MLQGEGSPTKIREPKIVKRYIDFETRLCHKQHDLLNECYIIPSRLATQSIYVHCNDLKANGIWDKTNTCGTLEDVYSRAMEEE